MKKHVLAALAFSLLAAPAFAEEAKAPHDGPGGRGPDRFMTKVDGDKDGKVSKAEWDAKGTKMFNESDANKDGFISREEAQAFHEKRKAKWQERKAEWKAKQEAAGKTE